MGTTLLDCSQTVSARGDAQLSLSPASAGDSTASDAFLILLVVVVLSVSALTPPFQSPDEFNHAKRAYLLSKGHVFLGSVDGATGGPIDTGLLEYMAIFESLPFLYDEKVTQKMLRDSGRIAWSHENRFSSLPNTAVYFPFSYIPQAVAFLVGEHSGLSVANSYSLARTFSLLASLFLLRSASRLHAIPLPVWALFTTPMVIFQLSSSSLDSISFAMCVLVATLFTRATDHRLQFGVGMHLTLLSCLFLLVTSRTNLVGVVWLPLLLYWTRRESAYLISSCILIILCFAWIILAALTVEGVEIRIQTISPANLLWYYLGHVDELVSVMYVTLTSGTLLLGYWRMFVGVLGWIDTPLDWAAYWAFALGMGALAMVSVPSSAKMLLSPARLALGLGAVFSTLALFVIFLVTFTLHPANFVGAIQGRYFYPMAIFLGFALFDRPRSPLHAKIGSAIIVGMVLLSIACMVPKLVGRYWAA